MQIIEFGRVAVPTASGESRRDMIRALAFAAALVGTGSVLAASPAGAMETLDSGGGGHVAATVDPVGALETHLDAMRTGYVVGSFDSDSGARSGQTTQTDGYDSIESVRTGSSTTESGVTEMLVIPPFTGSLRG